MSQSHTPTAPVAGIAAGAAYRYDTFTTGLMLADLRFGKRAPAPGTMFPALALETPDGTALSSDDLRGRPFLLVLGSLTCPMTASAADGLHELHEEFGGDVEFISVYTREAHPGERVPQACSLEEKHASADALAARDGYRWRNAVDSLDGALHRQLDSKPNAAFLVDGSGRLVFRALWASDVPGLLAALAAVARGELPRRDTSSAMLVPMLRALPWIDRIVGGGGRKATRDLWRAAPPMAAMAFLARRAARSRSVRDDDRGTLPAAERSS